MQTVRSTSMRSGHDRDGYSTRKLRSSAPLLGMIISLLLSSACGGGGSSATTPGTPGNPGTPGPTATSINLSPQQFCRVSGSSLQFTATVVGTDQRVAWSVDGVDGGNSSSGSISTTGLYTPPATITGFKYVTVGVRSIANPSLTAAVRGEVSSTSGLSYPNLKPFVAVNQTYSFTVNANCAETANAQFSVNGVAGGNADIGTIRVARSSTDEVGTKYDLVYTAPAALPKPKPEVRLSGTMPGTSNINDATLFIVPQVYAAITPNAPTVRTGTQQKYSGTVYGAPDHPEMRWFVNGVEGGNATVGTVTVNTDPVSWGFHYTALYQAPAALPPEPVQVIMKAVADPTQSAISQVALTVADPARPQLEWLKTETPPAGENFSMRSVFVDGTTVFAAGDQISAANSSTTLLAGAYDTTGVKQWYRSYPAVANASDTQGVVALSHMGGTSAAQFFTTTGRCGALSVSNGDVLIDPLLHPLFSSASDAQWFGGTTYVANTSMNANQVSTVDASCNAGGNLFTVSNAGAITSVAVTDNGYATADFEYDSTGTTNVRSVIRKFDTNGNERWNYVLDDRFQCRTVVDAQENVYVGCVAAKTFSLPHSSLEITKFDANGTQVWTREWDGDNWYPDQGNWNSALKLGPDGSIVALVQLTEIPPTGLCLEANAANCHDIGAWAVSSNGDVLWKLRHDLNKSPGDAANALAFDAQNHMYIVGSTVLNATLTGENDHWSSIVTEWTLPARP